MSDTPRILFLTEWFDPEHAYKGLRFTRALRDAGLDMEVATAFPNYPGGKVFEGYKVRPYMREVMDGIRVHRLFVSPSHDRSSLRRMVTYTSFFVSALIFLLFRMRRYDALYVYNPPIMPGLAAALAGLVHRRPFILEIQDLWPDTVASSGMAGKWVLRILGPLCRFTYKRAAMIVCQSDGMIETLSQRGVSRDKMVRIYNWSNYVAAVDDESGAHFPAAMEPHFEGRFNLVYGGNIGQAQALETVVEAVAKAAKDAPRLRLHIVGRGIDRDAIASLAATIAPDHVLLHEGVPSVVMDRIFDRADGLVLHLKDDPLYDITIPSKSQHYLSVGKPVIAGISGEAGRLLEQSKAARVVANGDVEAMAEAMVSLANDDAQTREAAGEAGRAYYKREMGFPNAIAKTVGLLRELVASR